MKELKRAYKEYVKCRDDYIEKSSRLSEPLKRVLMRAWEGSRKRLEVELERVLGER